MGFLDWLPGGFHWLILIGVILAVGYALRLAIHGKD